MTNRNSNSINVPEAREAMDKFKMEAASEVGVDLKQTARYLHALPVRVITTRPALRRSLS